MSLILGKVFQALRAEGVGKVDVASDLHYSLQDLDEAIFGLVLTGFTGGGQRGVRQPNGPSNSPRAVATHALTT